MKLLIDMNLSPLWVPALRELGWEAAHWSDVGRVDATDEEIFRYASLGGYVILTHDLDFGAILAATGAQFPSVVQVRAQNVTPGYLLVLVSSALRQFEEHLENGALISIDEKKQRARVLPLRR